MRRGLGLAAVLVGIVGAVVLWLMAEQRYDDGVARLARAPIGCQTVLDFDQTGQFLVFAETRGRFDDVRGDCTASGSFRAERPDPTVSVEIDDPAGAPVEVVASTGADYDRDDFAGVQVGHLNITEPGDHVVRVTSDDGEFAVAVGNDPYDGVFALRGGAVVALVMGLVVGAALFVRARRDRADRSHPLTTSAPPEPAWWGSEPPPVYSPPERPSRPPPIPGQPPGPGWAQPTNDHGPPTSPPRRPSEDDAGAGSTWGPPRA